MISIDWSNSLNSTVLIWTMVRCFGSSEAGGRTELNDLTEEIELLANEDACCQRLMTVPGIGPTIASAIVSAVGNASGFASSRDLSAWLGLVPRQMSTGDRTILGRISKRGNRYVRTLLVQAAHIILVRRPQTAREGLWPWIEAASKRLQRNILVIALANKIARIAWVLMSRGERYEERAVPAAQDLCAPGA